VVLVCPLPDVDLPLLEVDVRPDEPAQLRRPQPAEHRRQDQRPEASLDVRHDSAGLVQGRNVHPTLSLPLARRSAWRSAWRSLPRFRWELSPRATLRVASPRSMASDSSIDRCRQESEGRTAPSAFQGVLGRDRIGHAIGAVTFGYDTLHHALENEWSKYHQA